MNTVKYLGPVVLAIGLCIADPTVIRAHDGHGHAAATYEVTAAEPIVGQRLQLNILDDQSGEPVAARFSLTIDGTAYVPNSVSQQGLRFVSIHSGKNQRFVATYTRGLGIVEIPLPENARRVTVIATKGLEYVSTEAIFDVQGEVTDATLRMRCCSNISAEGWFAADEHLHYERTDPKHDVNWLTMLDGDGLLHAHFLVLRGGNLPGIWAEQFAYGKAGEGTDGRRLIRPGEEYRDRSQGHINLLGIGEVIHPITTGSKSGNDRFNYPPMLEVFRRTHDLGGIGGPAHGGALAISSTSVLDTVLGEVDFFEIANTNLYKTDVWYQLMNCGYVLPPAAGTDLPNNPFRDPWQPFLGETRMYVRVGEKADFLSWTQALKKGSVFVTSGPLIQFSVDGVGPGGVVRLPATGGEIELTALLSSPRPLTSLEIVQLGMPIETKITRSKVSGIEQLQTLHRMNIKESCWLAARGTGEPKVSLKQQTKIEQNAIAHTGAVRVLVGDHPVRSVSDVDRLVKQLHKQQEYYRSEAVYEKAEHRLRFLDLFERAIERLEQKR